jgi:hypothetical protein
MFPYSFLFLYSLFAFRFFSFFLLKHVQANSERQCAQEQTAPGAVGHQKPAASSGAKEFHWGLFSQPVTFLNLFSKNGFEVRYVYK